MAAGSGHDPVVEPLDGEWLVIIDPQAIFTSPAISAWGSPMWASTVPHVLELATAYGPERTIITRYVADPGLGGSWEPYLREWPFALVPDSDPLYAVIPELSGLAERVVTEPTFGKWGPALVKITGRAPRLAVAGVSTDCCVIATALPAGDAGAWVRVVERACAGSTRQNHKRAIGAMALFSPQIVIV